MWLFSISAVAVEDVETTAVVTTMEDDACASCHKDKHPGLYQQWKQSKHAQNNVGCIDCHEAAVTDVDAFAHNGHNIAVIVSPKDCANCHNKIVDEFKRSYHTRAGQILPAEQNNVFGAIVGGPASVVVGCAQCHGSRVELDENNRPSVGWPNTGIGRVNPDGSNGACTACHPRHNFSRAVARTPEACGKCHLGPDHPQIEIYTESKHGNIYYSGVHDLNMESDDWVAGIDYSATPTCATCHIGAAPGISSSHDMDERLSVNLRAKVSYKINLIRLADGKQYDLPVNIAPPKMGETYTPPAGKGEPGKVVEILTSDNRRDNMKQVCKACHSSDHTNQHYENLDDFVDLYNNKFAIPTSSMMAALKEKGFLNSVPNDQWIEWLWWEIWHHEGRRARSGAAMMAPDYAWWHGIYDVAKRFYMEFIPEVLDLAGEVEGWRLLNTHFKSVDEHSWYFEGLATRPAQTNLVVLNTATGEVMAEGEYATLNVSVDSGAGLNISGTLDIAETLSSIMPWNGLTSGVIVVIVNKDTGKISFLNSSSQLAPVSAINALGTISEMTLQASQTVEINTGALGFAGEVDIYIGFNLVNNVIAYFPIPISAVVTE